jgi:hypothetical protein
LPLDRDASPRAFEQRIGNSRPPVVRFAALAHFGCGESGESKQGSPQM